MKSKLILIPVVLLSATAQADPENLWKFSVEVGLESDSNVVVEDVEKDSGADNMSRQVRLAVGYNKKTKDQTSFGASYSYFNKDYNSLDEFDSDIHLLNLKLARKFDDVKLGLSAVFADAGLNDEDFIQIKQLSPNLSYFFSKKNYLYTSYSFGQKDFAERDERSADHQEFTLNLYHLFSGLNNYLTAGVKYKDEDAKELLYNYQQLELKLGYTYRSKIANFPTKLGLSYRYQKRDYDSDFHPLIDDFRYDKRNQVQLTYKIELPHRLYSEFELTRNFNQSNLESADYDQTKLGMVLGYQFQ